MTGRYAGTFAAALGALLLVSSGCREIPEVEPEPVRTTPPAVIEIEVPASVGEPRRPVVEFDHGAHETALQDEGCERCHSTEEEGLGFAFVDRDAITTRDDLLEQYHTGCGSCHDERRDAGADTGPETTVCAACHVKQLPAVSARIEVRFDRSLHGRHTVAMEDRCEECHHVYDEPSEQRIYREEQEAACFVCHGDGTGEDGPPPLEEAAHDACVNCHLRRAGQNTGPTTCAGCHDEAQLASVARLDPPPRIERGQEDQVTIHAEWSQVSQVPFDHAAHEARTGRCSDCHHANLEACDICHTSSGLPDGGGVSLEQAYHQATSARSCVGCHDDETEQTGCAGCHVATPVLPVERSCALCHVEAPPASTPPSDMLVQGATPDPGNPEPSTTSPRLAEWPPLPPSSDDFPENVTIVSLADVYQASELPHRVIVEELERSIRDSALATHFHDGPGVTCTGCHHHTPVGERPPPCASCHDSKDRMDQDRPSLKHAYHRQCMDCHEKMAIDKLGCTDCHAEARKEDPE